MEIVDHPKEIEVSWDLFDYWPDMSIDEIKQTKLDQAVETELMKYLIDPKQQQYNASWWEEKFYGLPDSFYPLLQEMSETKPSIVKKRLKNENKKARGRPRKPKPVPVIPDNPNFKIHF